MRFLILTALKDLRLRLRDPAALLIWLGIPLMIGGLLSLMSSGGSTPKGKLLIVDQAGSFVSGLLSHAGGGPLEEMLDIETVTLESGRERIDAGDASALLIVPKGFSDAVLLAETPATLTLVTNPAQRILPSIIEQALEMAVDGTFYLQRVFAGPLQQLAVASDDDMPLFDEAIFTTIGAELSQTFESLDGVLMPPVLTVETAVQTKSKTAGLNIGTLFLPGMLFMSVLFVAQGVSGDLWREREQGTLRRVVSAPHPLTGFVGGKLLAAGAMMAAMALVACVVAVLAFEVSIARLPLAIVWSTLVGVALLALFTAVQLVSKNRRAGNVLTTVVMFPMMMIGGTFFPFEAMPSWMVAVGKWTPNGLGVIQLKRILFGSVEPLGLLQASVGIGLPTAIAIAFIVRRVSGSFAIGE